MSADDYFNFEDAFEKIEEGLHLEVEAEQTPGTKTNNQKGKKKMKQEIDNLLIAEFWIHGDHEKESEGVQWDLINILGTVEVIWLYNLFKHQDVCDGEIIDMLIRAGCGLNCSTFLLIRPTFDYMDYFFEIIGKAK